MSEETTGRPTRTFQTPNGHKIVLNEYITGREKRSIKEIWLRNMQMRQTGDTPEISGVEGSAATEAENMALQCAVVSVDGKPENVVELVLDLPSVDYDAIVDAVNELTSDEGDKKK